METEGVGASRPTLEIDLEVFEMAYEEVEKLLAEKNIARPGFGSSEEEIREAERKLGFRLPESFRWLQKNYSFCDMPNGDILYGVTQEGLDGDLVHRYSEDVEEGLCEPHLVCFYIGNAVYYFFDISNRELEEYPILEQSEEDDDEPIAMSFDEFFVAKLRKM